MVKGEEKKPEKSATAIRVPKATMMTAPKSFRIYNNNKCCVYSNTSYKTNNKLPFAYLKAFNKSDYY